MTIQVGKNLEVIGEAGWKWLKYTVWDSQQINKNTILKQWDAVELWYQRDRKHNNDRDFRTATLHFKGEDEHYNIIYIYIYYKKDKY